MVPRVLERALRQQVRTHTVIWLVWAAFVTVWCVAALAFTLKCARLPNWRPGFLNRQQLGLGVNLTTKRYALLLWIGALLGLSSGFWLPQLLIRAFRASFD